MFLCIPKIKRDTKFLSIAFNTALYWLTMSKHMLSCRQLDGLEWFLFILFDVVEGEIKLKFSGMGPKLLKPYILKNRTKPQSFSF